MANPWFQTFKSTANTILDSDPIQLYTFHHAGGSCQYFQPWAAKLPPWIQLTSMQLPGRWNRVAEPAFLRLEKLTPVLGDAFQEILAANPKQKFAFYGHSLGGLIAYDLTKYLTKNHLPLPVHLFISSKRSLLDAANKFPIYELPIDKFAIVLSELYGPLPAEIAADPDMKAMFLDITKKDMELLDTYTYIPDPMLNVPLTILGGTEDHVITLDSLQSWKDLTAANCEIVQFPGGHFFLKSPSEDAVLNKIVSVLGG